MLERYDATLAAHPALAGRLAPLRAAVAAHVTALDPDQPRRTPSATPSATGAPAAAGAPKASGTPQASGAPAEAVPAKPEEAVTALAEAERDLAETRTVALAEAPGELARLLASVAACGAVHHHLLTSTPGAAQ
ncbi:hypothetical protein [Streptomyces sp. NPDC090022]|uniref:hypothetical protein n=1 Tax=Streptomyces sp. NPDC090022 TaxID=3365920 RepID=UPI003820671D